MKKILLILAVTFSTATYSQLTDANFQQAIDDCLATNPVDGMCSDSEYGAMPDLDVSNVTDMSSAFDGRNTFNGDLSSWDTSSMIYMKQMFYNADAFNQDVSTWDVSNVTDMTSMFDNSGVSTDNYDNILIGWSSQTLQSNVPFGANGINYCWGENARQSLIDTYGWIITDDGLDCSTASVDDQNQLDISIYPNPTSDMVYIDGNYTQLKVVVYDILGKQVMNKSITNSIDISQLEKGVYILQLSDGVKLTTQRIVKN